KEAREDLESSRRLATQVHSGGSSSFHPLLGERVFLSPPAWVQVWVRLKKEKWLPISRKRHQIGHLDFRSFRLLTEMLEVRILPGEPTPLSFNELRTFSGNSAIRRCDVECANYDQSRSIKTHKDQLRQVSMRFVRSIAANRDQTEHSARDRILGM